MLPCAVRRDQRARVLSCNSLILLAPRAGLEPATKRLTSAALKSAMPHGDIAPFNERSAETNARHPIGEARSRSPLTPPAVPDHPDAWAMPRPPYRRNVVFIYAI